jgi:bacillopeptidase F
VVVATLDSGVDVNHPDLRDRWRGGVNSWFDPNGEHLEPFDQDGHGTQTMGILVGGDASGEAIGVAPDARWIAAKIYNDLGIATLSGIHEAFQWLLDPDGDSLTDDAPSLVVCPWGVDVALDRCEPEFHPDIQALKTAGIAVVFAAGNDGPGIGTSSPPANAPGSLAAGAVDSSATVATFSSRGPSACGGGLYPQLAAPGVNVKTADLTAGGVFPNSYRTVSGTSYAAPHIGGALALLQSALPQTDPDQLEAALFRSAMDVGSAGPDFSTGYGIVDVVAAYADLMAEPVCADADSDGFFAEPGCGTPVDCDDRDAAVHPGATEMAQDGVDQDCNGFDLTIKVRRAVYFTRTQVLKVMATSDLRGEAGLSVSGFGAMHFQGGRTWSMILQGVQTNPSSITVTGIEGAHVVQVQPRPRPRGGGLAWASHW